MAGAPDSELLSDVARIRRVLARELETINEYEAFAQASSHPEVRAFFMHLAAEEKEHVFEATHMLRLLDPGQDAHFSKPIATGHFQQAVASGAPAAAPPASPAPPSGPPSGDGRRSQEPLTQLPPQRLMHGLPPPPAPPHAGPLTVGSLRRAGGGGNGGGGRDGR
jgi:hypothetical protein